MAELIRGLDAARVRARLDDVRAEIAAAAARAGRDPGAVEVLAAIKYVACEELPVLAAAGIAAVGENRAQELVRKQDAHPGLFGAWDFIGHLQSRRVRDLAGRVRRIHSVASRSALAQIEQHAQALAGTELLIEVNLAGEESKSGIAPEELAGYLADAALPVVGLMAMPPLAGDPEASRPWFARLRELAGEHGLRELSMGTTQDFAVAVEEGATVVRIGTRLYR